VRFSAERFVATFKQAVRAAVGKWPERGATIAPDLLLLFLSQERGKGFP
jgi:hypothetical protein